MLIQIKQIVYLMIVVQNLLQFVHLIYLLLCQELKFVVFRPELFYQIKDVLVMMVKEDLPFLTVLLYYVA